MVASSTTCHARFFLLVLSKYTITGMSYPRRHLTKNDEGVEVERRWVVPPPAKGHHYYDADSIPPEWHQVGVTHCFALQNVSGMWSHRNCNMCSG